MNRLSSTARITIGLSCLAVSIVLAAQTFGLLPDRRSERLKGRSTLCEALAINCSLLASKGDVARMEASLKAIVRRNEDILSAGIRSEEGELLVDVKEHSESWHQKEHKKSTDSHMFVPIMAGDESWGKVEIRFRPISQAGWLGYFTEPLVMLAAFVGFASMLIFYLYLRKMLRHLDPSKVVPDRVRAALDTLAEGLLVLDKDDRIVLANRSFTETVGIAPEKLQGRRASELPWIGKNENDKPEQFPWSESMSEGKLQSDVMLGLKSRDNERRTFKVNASPILGGDGKCRGTLASFNDVTVIEKNRVDLKKMLDMLKRSRDEIGRQNEELQVLATQDPLTGCFNRRSFFSEFESHFNLAQSRDKPLSCIMIDVDHFKSVNDQHGHAVGDEVLKKVAASLRDQSGDSDFVCRYGGEEFCILLPDTDIDGAKVMAERCRSVIEATRYEQLSVTASLGISAIELGAHDPHEMLNQADKCLYVAKRNGRNQVVSWQDVPEDLEIDNSESSQATEYKDQQTRLDIPFHAVTALVSALSYRDTSTAEHSRRVADLSVALASEIMSVSDAYVIEIAALLHDIGKIGVPDAILLKPGPLTKEEWQTMGIHDRIGVEILQSTFDCDELTNIVLTHHAWYGGSEREPDLPTGNSIPLGARILSIVDAYDAMISDRVYRKGRGQEEAFTELRRCAGIQFDPELVERFIQVAIASDISRTEALPPVSKQTALKIGLEIERLVGALDEEDIFGLGALAGRLKQTAIKDGVPQIAEVACQLERAAANDQDMMELVQLTTDLLDLCRMTQNAYLKDSPELDYLSDSHESATS